MKALVLPIKSLKPTGPQLQGWICSFFEDLLHQESWCQGWECPVGDQKDDGPAVPRNSSHWNLSSRSPWGEWKARPPWMMTPILKYQYSLQPTLSQGSNLAWGLQSSNINIGFNLVFKVLFRSALRSTTMFAPKFCSNTLPICTKSEPQIFCSKSFQICNKESPSLLQERLQCCSKS